MHRALILAAALALPLASTSGAATQPSDQDAAYRAAQSGEIRSLGEIQSRVGMRIRGEFLGSDFDSREQRYILKYLRDGSVVVVDVDARTGNILGTRP